MKFLNRISTRAIKLVLFEMLYFVHLKFLHKSQKRCIFTSHEKSSNYNRPLIALLPAKLVMSRRIFFKCGNVLLLLCKPHGLILRPKLFNKKSLPYTYGF